MKKILLNCFLILASFNLSAQNSTYQWKTATSGGYNYKYITNDPLKSRFYTLKNGLTVILSSDFRAPEINFNIIVRAGSNSDPKNATGVAHYLEHLMFKGTDKFGTANWTKEKPLLDKIDALYEKYNKTTDAAQRKEIYKEIDKVSGEASNFAILNEYDKMIQEIGGGGGAGTSAESTDYSARFPSNAVDKFLAIESERFRKPVFRTFHTELEAVYEEMNTDLDSDIWRLVRAMESKLFPTHNYGQQSGIGTIEHLKNPSLIEIRNYYNRYYVPNNMAVILVGDLNPDEMIKKVDKAFSYMVPKPLSLYNPAPEKPLTNIQRVDLYGPNEEMLEIYYRGYAENSKESLMLSLISSILKNGKAGLFDINLNKQQKLLSAHVNYSQKKDYGVFNLSARPKQGQSLDEAAKLLLEQIQLLKDGKFEDELLTAIVANRKLSSLEYFDDRSNRLRSLTKAFILNKGTGYDRTLNETNNMAKITKEEVIAFANTFFKDNYVIGYKHKGEDKNIVKIEKPPITPIHTNTGLSSEFARNLMNVADKPIVPKFLDYQKNISFGKSGIAEVLAVKNTENSIFKMTYRFNLGNKNNKLLRHAVAYLPYLGTEKYTAEELSREFYKIACSYRIDVKDESTILEISGLQENFDKAVALVEHIFANVVVNEKALAELKSSILKTRENSKLDKRTIMNGLTSYAQYGRLNPFNNVLSNDEVKNIRADDLIYLLKNLKNYEHVITYYGPKDITAFTADIQQAHALPKAFTPVAPANVYTYSIQDSNRVYFINYDMVQSEICWWRNTGLYNKADETTIKVFNNYFGMGMSSIVFQTIRESKSLAYLTYASYDSPDRPDKQCSMTAYVGTQADKMNEAISGMDELLNVLPKREKIFDAVKASLLSSYQSWRILNDEIFKRYFDDKKLGYNYDSRMDRYKEIRSVTFETINAFHREKLANKPYTYLILASDKNVTQEDMAKFGSVKTLTLKEIFGY
ncbi:M16 family metallopeptidase [Sphingobacterium spiritivorum]|uniref:Peptidase M16 inactive domain protein n=1 Tax=Sphingobacterium spiritivorum ATCC 33861 TaxID=525373 RepID=D7VSS8_SPHSI|nr:M16 family metallopeptidase [Sphingobacterium spiritivorum]EFK56829.1 peptidase M16 inactive domain protein [Sphingobacterium spiritivorum ATCC 33861]QQT35147.1 insulinase family protein [Sphingobacterium spiritivorum]WQD36051.1 insulinase family protein [Sphingobacterium spiritivorum]SUJ03614.1 protease3 [Sphingobacterium spiritivorum]